MCLCLFLKSTFDMDNTHRETRMRVWGLKGDEEPWHTLITCMGIERGGWVVGIVRILY